MKYGYDDDRYDDEYYRDVGVVRYPHFDFVTPRHPDLVLLDKYDDLGRPKRLRHPHLVLLDDYDDFGITRRLT